MEAESAPKAAHPFSPLLSSPDVDRGRSEWKLMNVKIRGIVMRLLSVVSALLLASPAVAQEAEQFYVIDRDPGMIRVIGLDSVDGGPTNTSVVVLDVWKQPKTLLLQTLEFNCQRSTYTVVAKSNGQTQDNKRGPTETIPMGSQLAEIGNLVCAGSGNLERSRVIEGTIKDVVDSVWGK